MSCSKIQVTKMIQLGKQQTTSMKNLKIKSRNKKMMMRGLELGKTNQIQSNQKMKKTMMMDSAISINLKNQSLNKSLLWLSRRQKNLNKNLLRLKILMMMMKNSGISETSKRLL